jgi:hypothetical protein
LLGKHLILQCHNRLLTPCFRLLFRKSVLHWQNNLPAFYAFCDYVENAETTKTLPGPEGVGLQLALKGYAKYIKTIYSSTHSNESIAEVSNTYNASSPEYADVSFPSQIADDRSYEWWECYWPIGYDVTAPPVEYAALISRMITDEYHMRICDVYFPEENNKTRIGTKHRTYEQLNEVTAGWSDRNSSRLLFTNGALDPWLHTTGSSRFRPGGPMKDSPQVPVKIVSDGGHCSDLSFSSCNAKPGCKPVLDFGIDQITKWVEEFHK